MKYLIMCEGPNELKIVDILLDAGRIKLKRDDLLGLSAYHARQIKTSTRVQAELKMYQGEVTVLRIGDKLNDKLTIPKEYKQQIKDVVNYCTLPELEILLIISENMYAQFEKVKTNKKPKQFAKEHISYHGVKYNNATAFYEEYYGTDCDKLVNAIRKYKQLHRTHSNEQHYLAELLG